jgi:chromosome segregation ATPase
MYEEEIRNLKGQLRNYTELQAQYEEAKVVIGKNTEDQDALKAQINVKENEIVQLKVTISNLQRAMA